MARRGYDSVNSTSVPAGGDVYPGYINGNWPTYYALKKRFPHKTIVPITVNSSTLNATVIDCETGDATITSASEWAKRKVARGDTPTIYCSWSVYSTLVRACRDLGLKPGRNVFFWIAWYTSDGSSSIPKGAGIIGRQYASPDGIDGSKVHDGNYDISVFKNHWPGVDPSRTRKAKQHIQKYSGWSWFRKRWFK